MSLLTTFLLAQMAICDLEKRNNVREVVKGMDQVIWCASGFSGRSQGRFQRLKFLMRVVRYDTVPLACSLV